MGGEGRHQPRRKTLDFSTQPRRTRLPLAATPQLIMDAPAMSIDIADWLRGLGLAHPRGTAGFSTHRPGLGEIRTVCWREMDSNHQYPRRWSSAAGSWCEL